MTERKQVTEANSTPQKAAAVVSQVDLVLVPAAWEWTCPKSQQTRTLNKPPRGQKALARWIVRPLYDQAALDAAVAAADRDWRDKMAAADGRVVVLTRALREALEFQNARLRPDHPRLGRWMRVTDDTPSHGPNVGGKRQ